MVTHVHADAGLRLAARAYHHGPDEEPELEPEDTAAWLRFATGRTHGSCDHNYYSPEKFLPGGWQEDTSRADSSANSAGNSTGHGRHTS
jgi:hypothetical protein